MTRLLLIILIVLPCIMHAQVQEDPNAVKVPKEEKKAAPKDEEKPVEISNERFVEMSSKIVFNGKLKKDLLRGYDIMIKVDDISQIYYQWLPIGFKEFKFLFYDNANIIRSGGNYFHPTSLQNVKATNWVLSFKVVRENDKPIYGTARYEITQEKTKLTELSIN